MALFDWFGLTRNKTYDKGIRAFDECRYEDAIEALDECLKETEDDSIRRLANFYISESFAQLGHTSLKNGNYERTLAWLEKALEQHPNYPDLHYGCAFAQKKLKRYDDAQLSVTKALSINPRYAKCVLLEGLIWLETGKKTEGINRIKQAGQLDESLKNEKFGWGLALIEAGDEEMAIGVFEAVTYRNSEDAMVHVRLGDVAIKRGKYPEACAEYEKALAISPIFADIRYRYGISLLGMGRPSDALHEFEKALQRNPKYSDAKFQYAKTLIELGELMLAKEALCELLSWDDAYPGARNLFDSITN